MNLTTSSHRKQRMAPEFQRGLSLIELMIAMTLGLAIVAAVGYVYVSGVVGYRVQNNQSRMQEDARFVVETVSRDVRMAGYMGCANPTAFENQTTLELMAGSPVMTVDTSWLTPNTPSTQNIDRFVDTSLVIRGVSAAASNASAMLPNSAKLSGSLQPGTDILFILRAGEEHGRIQSVSPTDVASRSEYTAPDEFSLPEPLPGVKAGDNVTVVISNCQLAKIVKPTYPSLKNGVATGNLKLQNSMNKISGDTSGKAEGDTGTFSAVYNDAVISLFSPSVFYVAKPTTTTGGVPSLRRVSIAQKSTTNYGGWADNDGGDTVATGVETFQTSYMVTTGIGTATAATTEATLADMEATPANWGNVTAVRVRFTMVSQEANTAVATTGGRLRQAYDFTVGIRGRQYKRDS
jgi:type IV pilus assembly protein PilW